MYCRRGPAGGQPCRGPWAARAEASWLPRMCEVKNRYTLPARHSTTLCATSAACSGPGGGARSQRPTSSARGRAHRVRCHRVPGRATPRHRQAHTRDTETRDTLYASRPWRIVVPQLKKERAHLYREYSYLYMRCNALSRRCQPKGRRRIEERPSSMLLASVLSSAH